MNIDKEFELFLKNSSKLIEIPSVISKEKENMPFGQEVYNALVKAIEIASIMNYKTFIDPNGYYGYAEIGEGELFGVLCHVDVVPEGDLSNWKHDPYQLTIENNKIYGRGIQDDKGPTLLSMHALKMLLDDGYQLKKRVRFIFGSDEETLWRCMDKYKQNEEIPKMGFTPDSIFPVTNAEKGLYQIEISSNEKIDFSFNGGEAINSVASQATIEYNKEIENSLINNNIEYSINDNEIKVVGKSAHVKDADKGDNAIVKLASILKQLNFQSNLLNFIVEKGSNPNGKLLFNEICDEISGKLMFNIGKAIFTKNIQTISIDMRIPVTYQKEKIDEVLNEVASQYNLQIKVVDYVKSLYVDENSELVKSLMKAYQEVSHDYTAKPLASGGATFSRVMDNFVAFGADLPTSISTAHQANECVDIDDYKKALEIYIKAFELLVF
ncbi:succinyl-diaminopimelate desuccinylase [Bacilli bacterium PM5-9]|nr:succinyl-diaminopimelate desuccinylase [Bacilli bacterium PM5-9]